jgi:ppGpp synthetase/RelA/SpoT-type nucleotidyltranferase
LVSKSRIDRAGRLLSQKAFDYDENALALDLDFEAFRRDHLEPLTFLSSSLQAWLNEEDVQFYIAQRLKRRPQILRKLRRFSVRLSQLQDIGGCRIIVESNEEVSRLRDQIDRYLRGVLVGSNIQWTDYRERGRDVTGYRALHGVMRFRGFTIEMQIRSRLQHYWAESIERTSVVYGTRLKESEGDYEVLRYFKLFSDALHTLEEGYNLKAETEEQLRQARIRAESIVSRSASDTVLAGRVNEDIIKAMSATQASKTQQMANWILVFDWNTGNFVTWEFVSRDPEVAMRTYSDYERRFTEEENYEVVLIGASDIASVPHTHSHYFGIEHHDTALSEMEGSLIGYARRRDLDTGARMILEVLHSRNYWGAAGVSPATLKNHFCQKVPVFDSSLNALRKKGFIPKSGKVSLNLQRKGEILEYL